MDLSTTYLGLRLRNPLIASASPMTRSVNGIRKLAAEGIGAVVLVGLHSFAAWGNRLAFEKAGITKATAEPEGGQILKDDRGQPSGILLNRATTLLTSAIPPATDAELQADVLAGLEAMAESGYVAVHEAGVDTRLMAALEAITGRSPFLRGER